MKIEPCGGEIHRTVFLLVEESMGNGAGQLGQDDEIWRRSADLEDQLIAEELIEGLDEFLIPMPTLQGEIDDLAFVKINR